LLNELLHAVPESGGGVAGGGRSIRGGLTGGGGLAGGGVGFRGLVSSIAGARNCHSGNTRGQDSGCQARCIEGGTADARARSGSLPACSGGLPTGTGGPRSSSDLTESRKLGRRDLARVGEVQVLGNLGGRRWGYAARRLSPADVGLLAGAEPGFAGDRRVDVPH
jgi:hypothetical protein